MHCDFELSDVQVVAGARDYFSGRDPVLEYVLSFR
jgi:hypothetical protein